MRIQYWWMYCNSPATKKKQETLIKCVLLTLFWDGFDNQIKIFWLWCQRIFKCATINQYILPEYFIIERISISSVWILYKGTTFNCVDLMTHSRCFLISLIFHRFDQTYFILLFTSSILILFTYRLSICWQLFLASKWMHWTFTTKIWK